MSSRRRIPIACVLTPTQAERQLGEWIDLHAHAISTDRVDGGVALTLPAELADDVENLAGREAQCCSFLDITTTRSDATIVVTIISAEPGALGVIEILTGSST